MADERASNEGFLQIGEAADKTGLTQRTLRYYEEKGLLRPPSRLDGGFRLYSDDDIARIENIKQLRDLLGFSLADIKEMLDADDVRLQVRAEWRKDADPRVKAENILRAREATAQQIAMIDQKVASMTEMRRQLAERLARYDGWLKERAPAPSASRS
jgi:DNA-binding transcriptional MerR regulator